MSSMLGFINNKGGENIQRKHINPKDYGRLNYYEVEKELKTDETKNKKDIKSHEEMMSKKKMELAEMESERMKIKLLIVKENQNHMREMQELSKAKYLEYINKIIGEKKKIESKRIDEDNKRKMKDKIKDKGDIEYFMTNLMEEKKLYESEHEQKMMILNEKNEKMLKEIENKLYIEIEMKEINDKFEKDKFKRQFLDNKRVITGKGNKSEKEKEKKRYYKRKTKIEIQKYKAQLKYKYKSEGIEFKRHWRKIDKIFELKEPKFENEKYNLQKEVKGKENGDKDSKKHDIKIKEIKRQLISKNMEVKLKNIVKNFLDQIKDKNSGDLQIIGNDTNIKMDPIKNKIKMIDKINFNEEQGFNTDKDFFDVFGITQTDSKNPKLDNEYINSNQINTKTEINNGFKYNNNMTQIKQNIYNRLKFNDAPMNVLFQANQKINNLFMYEPKYYNYFPKNKITDEQSINNNMSMNDK